MNAPMNHDTSLENFRKQCYAATMDDLTEQVNIFREAVERDVGPEATHANEMQEKYMTAMTVFSERLAAGEQFNQKGRIAALTKLYQEMDIEELSTLYEQMRQLRNSADESPTATHAERLMWERRFKRVAEVYDARTGRISPSAA